MTVPVKQTKVGRPSKYSKTLCREVLILLEQGMGIKNATKQCGISYNVWRQWMDKDEKLRDLYYKAKESGIEMLISNLDERIDQTHRRSAAEMVICVLRASFIAISLFPRVSMHANLRTSLTASRCPS